MENLDYNHPETVDRIQLHQRLVEKEIVGYSGAFATLNGGVLTVLAEVKRTLLVNPSFNGFNKPTPEELLQSEKFVNSISPTLYHLLQNSGDFMEGYLFSAGAYGLCTLFSVPKKYKIAASFLFSSGVIVAAETGYIQNIGTPDLNDIPAGILGAAAAIGVNFAGQAIATKAIALNKQYLLGEKLGKKIEAFDQKTGLVSKMRPFLEKIKQSFGFNDPYPEELILDWKKNHPDQEV